SLISAALDAGAEDVKSVDEVFEVYTGPGDVAKVAEALDTSGIKSLSAEVTRIPTTTARVEGKEANQVLKMLDMFEENDDVQNVHANFDIPDEVLETAAS